MTSTMMDVANIRFTQEHVYDSFNANSAKAGGVVELIEAILAGKMTPRDLPLIRVAPKRGAYWCVDNRRLFVYKHCQLGEIPVEVYSWKDMREFELKWRNGLATRSSTSEGRRAGVIQRTDTPFPRSPVLEPTLSQVHVYLSPAQQRRHDERIAALRRRREKRALATEHDVDGTGVSSGATAATALRTLLAPASARATCKAGGVTDAGADASGAKPLGKRRKKSRKASAAGTGGAGVEDLKVAEGAASRTASRAEVGAERGSNGGAVDAAVAPSKRKRRRKSLGDEPRHAAGATSAGSACAAADAPVRLTVALGQEESGDEAYDVELTAM